jgi:uncharacterized protein YPO0396
VWTKFKRRAGKQNVNPRRSPLREENARLKKLVEQHEARIKQLEEERNQLRRELESAKEFTKTSPKKKTLPKKQSKKGSKGSAATAQAGAST